MASLRHASRVRLLQGAIPIELSAAAFASSVLGLFFVRPRTVILDEPSRTLVLRATRWLRRPRVVRIPYDDVQCVQLRSFGGVLHLVRVLDGEGKMHAVTGLGWSRAKAKRVARALTTATDLEHHMPPNARSA